MVKAKKSGFTLIEVLVIIFLLGIILVIGSSLFFQILKGGAKTEVTKEVKQNGNYVIDVTSRMIRNAKEVVSCAGNAVVITNPDNNPTTFACRSVGEAEGRIASNGARLTSEKVKVDECSITCLGSPVKEVNLSFRLSQKEATTRVEELSTQEFQTKVLLRVY